MTTQSTNIIVQILNDSNGSSTESTKASITKILCQVKRYQEKIRKHIDDNYIDFMPNHTSADLYLDEGEALVKEADHLLQNIGSDTNAALREASIDLQEYVEQLQECALGLKISYKILKIDDLFQCVEESNAGKEYLVVLDLLGKLKSLIYENDDETFRRCECYDTIKVKYHIQSNILQQNLKQQFESLVQLTEKPFPSTKCVTVSVSKDENQLQDTVMALFQARYNPIQICDFLVENCFEPIITKPVSIECTEDNIDFIQLKLSYTQKTLSVSLRPSYKQVFENIRLLLHCLSNINVSISETQHVFTVFGDHIKERLLKLLVDECLMHSIPETMDELQESTLVEDVLQFEQFLADTFLINPDEDKALTEFTEKFETYFKNRFCKKILETAKDIMQKDLQDMTLIAEKNTPEDVANNPFMFPRCMVSKSTLELIKLMERILRQQSDSEDNKDESHPKIIFIMLNFYIYHVPEIHAKLLESIPQQSALFYNNCMFLAHWVATNSEKEIPTFPALVKTLQATGTKHFDEQIAYQQKIVMGILREFALISSIPSKKLRKINQELMQIYNVGFGSFEPAKYFDKVLLDLTSSITHSLGAAPLKLIRQCLRQLDLLRNVWQNVLPDTKYNKTFYGLLDDLCSEFIKRIIAMEDISTTVANELSEIIGVIIEKAPTLFQEKHHVIQIKSWMKLQQLKIILNASLQEITEQWCGGAGILTANYKADEIKHLIRALFQNTDRRANALAKIV